MRVDISFLPAAAAVFLLIFARIGTMIMLLPGIGEAAIPVRVRLVSALLLAALLFPLHRAAFTLDLSSFFPVLLLLGQELLVGAVLGLTARLAVSALQVAGNIVAQQLGLAYASSIDPTQGQQAALLANFLTLLGVTLLFATNLHHLAISALHESYSLFRPGEMPFTGDMAALTIRTISSAFRIGVQLSAPFLVFGLLFNFGLGILSRLMPQMQVFFVGVPLSILAGFVVLLLVVGALMGVFLGHLEGVLRELSPHG